MSKNQRAKDLRAPLTHLEFDGKMYPVKIDLNAFRIAEEIYEDEYHRDKNFAEIAVELSKGRLGAIMAVCYAGLVSGGLDVTWANYASLFKLTDIPGLKDRMAELVADALPDPEGDGKGEGPLAEDAPSPGAGSVTLL